MNSLIPRSFFMPSLWDEEDDFWSMSSQPSGLSVSEDKNNVYVEAQVPGVDPSKIEVTFDKGMLWIKAYQEQEEKSEEKKYYKKSASSFSYHVRLPESVNSSKEPEAVCKNGVMKVTFTKSPEVEPKKIAVKSE
jgi:HSP20 family protein